MALGFTLSIDFMEIFNTHDLESVASMGGAGFPALGESSYYGIERVVHNFTTLYFRHLFCFVGPQDYYVILLSRVRFV